MTPMLVVPRLSSAPPSTAAVSTVLGLRRSAVVSLALPKRALVHPPPPLPAARARVALLVPAWVIVGFMMVPTALVPAPAAP